jgi:flagellar motor switch protein FliN
MSSLVVNRLELPPLVAGPDKGEKLGERLDLVEHVAVKLSVALGGAEMPIGRLFALRAGDVVALDRDVDAPVDLRLHGKTVARGHLVAIGDKFGVRIAELHDER